MAYNQHLSSPDHSRVRRETGIKITIKPQGTVNKAVGWGSWYHLQVFFYVREYRTSNLVVKRSNSLPGGLASCTLNIHVILNMLDWL